MTSRGMTRGGLPHSEIVGSTRVCHSPTLFAAYHVLLRLLVPRHPPCALTSLTPKGFETSSQNRSHRFAFLRLCRLASDSRLLLTYFILTDYRFTVQLPLFQRSFCRPSIRGSLSFTFFPILHTTWLSKSFGRSRTRLLAGPSSAPTGVIHPSFFPGSMTRVRTLCLFSHRASRDSSSYRL